MPPKPFVPLEAYPPGSMKAPALPPSEAGPVAQAVAEPIPPLQPHRSKVLRFDPQGNPMVPGAMPGQPVQADVAESFNTPLRGSRARMVTAETIAAEAPEAETPDADLPEWMQEMTDSERQKFDALRQSEGGLEKAWLHAQRKIGEQGTNNKALLEQIHDMLAAQQLQLHPGSPVVAPSPATAPPDLAKLQTDIEQFGKNFLDLSDDERGKKMSELITTAAHAAVQPVLQQQAATVRATATEAVLSEYPGLFSEDPKRRLAEGVYVDGLVQMYGAPTLANLRKALDDFAKERGYMKPGKAPKENPDVTAMREAASTVAPPSATVKKVGKIYKRSELARMQIQNPDKYRELQPDIMRAYAEGRVND
ncbi:MAG TPA: hypothetical protein VFS39_03820 [Nitrospira sp.]|nr:hypothetical protein [Nitrospira sp.]